MTNLSRWFDQTPAWVWWSFFPGFGGLAISYAGYKSNTQPWIAIGLGCTALALVTSSSGLAAWMWLTQIGIAFYLKRQFLVKTYPKHLSISEDSDLIKQISSTRKRVDINDCSKNELVNSLGIPIVYANDIETLRNEGFIFTHLEELSEIIGIPESKVTMIAPLVTFSYDHKKELNVSWKRLNTFSLQDFVNFGLTLEVAQKIVKERERGGDYKSLIDVKRRTRILFSSYQSLM